MGKIGKMIKIIIPLVHSVSMGLNFIDRGGFQVWTKENTMIGFSDGFEGDTGVAEGNYFILI